MAEQPNQRRWNDSVSELPAFHGNEKDTISAESIVHRVEAAANALTWDDEATYNNFSLAMRSNAEEWLNLQANIRGPEFRRSWAYIKPLFRAAFGSKMDESKVFLALREIGQKPSECIRDFAIRFNKGWRTIKDLMKPKAINVPANEADRTVAVCQGLYAQGFSNAQMEFQRIMFVSTMEMPLLTRVVQKDIPTFVDVMDVATKIESLTKASGSTASIHKITEPDETSDAEFVNQIQHGYHNNRGNYRGNNRGRSNSRGQSRGNRGNSRGNYSNSGSSSNQQQSGSGSQNQNPAPGQSQPVKCMFCQSIGHHQDKCNKRIAAGKPCVSASGKNYFPRKVSKVSEQDLDQEFGQSASNEQQNAVRENNEYLFL
jgi:hypothetical protein